MITQANPAALASLYSRLARILEPLVAGAAVATLPLILLRRVEHMERLLEELVRGRDA